MNKDIKELVEVMCKAVEMTGSVNGLGDDLGIVAKTELAMYMMYLSASDGDIARSEAEAISDICKLELNADELAYFVQENNILKPEFAEVVPVTYKIMIKTDNNLKGMGNDEVKFSDYVLETYKAIGDLIIKADEDVKDEEIKNYEKYMAMMEAYRAENLQ